MGNSIGGRKKVKIMKIDGETFKVKTPTTALDVTKDHPGHVLLDSEAVKHFGIRAKPLEPQQHLKPNKTYFLLDIPKFATSDDHRAARRVRSGINMTARDRLDCLMLSRRSVSDLTLLRPPPSSSSSSSGLGSGGPGPVRVKMRLPRAQVEKLVQESRDEVEVAERIIGLYMGNGGAVAGDADVAARDGGSSRREEWRPARPSITENHKAREKRVSFLPIEEGESRLAVAAS